MIFPSKIREVTLLTTFLVLLGLSSCMLFYPPFDDILNPKSGGGSGGKPGSTTTSIPTSGLIGEWLFSDGVSAGVAVDTSPSNHQGITNGSPTAAVDRFGNAGKAVYFDGAANIDCGNYFSFFTNNFTISAWIKLPDTNQYYEGVSICSISGPAQAAILYQKGVDGINFQVNTISSWVSLKDALNFQTNTWYHLVLSLDISNSMFIFVNGRKSYYGQIPAPIYNSLADLWLGKRGDNSYPMTGMMDDVRFYNRVLSDAEVDALYHEGGYNPVQPVYSRSGLVGEWLFNGNASDTSSFGNNGAVSGAVLTNDRYGKANSAYWFNNVVSNYIDLGSPSILNNLPTNDFTISSWVNIKDSTNGPQTIIGCYEHSGSFGGWGLQIWSNQILYSHVGTTNFLVNHNYQSPYIMDNNWIHVVSVYQFSTRTATVYNNGVFITNIVTNHIGTNSYLDDSALPKNIGRIPHDSGVQYFKGAIDDVRIYNRALSSNEIESLYLEN